MSSAPIDVDALPASQATSTASSAPVSQPAPNGVAGAPGSHAASASQPRHGWMNTEAGPGTGPSAPAAASTSTPAAAVQSSMSRREEESARKDRSLGEFLGVLDGYEPLIPDEVTDYYLQRAGFECNDPRLKRLVSLAAQKFVSDLSSDAFHYARLRVSGQTSGSRNRPGNAKDKNRVTLTMDDLGLALGEHGVNVKKPEYYL